jgi:RimJ/RimL family protein N-acetyltransferase
MVDAARASLREEGRPDPFEGDPVGFRRWVRGRMPRATVVEVGRAIRFVGYADVQCERGWLLQGIYTWPRYRRRGLAAAGFSVQCRRAFAAAADHVQLSVVAGNTAAENLYERLGFRPFARLRTILFR